MWIQQPDAFTLVQFRLECGPDLLLKWFERSDLYYKTHEVTRCKRPYIFSLFFIKMKLSSRLCLTHKRVTQKYRNSKFIKKKKKKKKPALGSDRNWPILRIFWIGSDRIWKNGIVASLLRMMDLKKAAILTVERQHFMSCSWELLMFFFTVAFFFKSHLRWYCISVLPLDRPQQTKVSHLRPDDICLGNTKPVIELIAGCAQEASQSFGSLRGSWNLNPNYPAWQPQPE